MENEKLKKYKIEEDPQLSIGEDIWKMLSNEITDILRIFHNVPLDVLSEHLITKGYNMDIILTMYKILYDMGIIEYDSSRNYIQPAIIDRLSAEERFASRAAFCIYNKVGDLEKKMVAQAKFPFDFEFLDKQEEPCFCKTFVEGKTEITIDLIRSYKHLKKYHKLIFIKPQGLNCSEALKELEHSYTLYTFDGDNKILSITEYKHENPDKK